MSKILVVVYSYTGACRRLAELLCNEQGWPMAEISDARPRGGVLGTRRCLFVASRRESLPDVAAAPVMGGSGALNAIAEIGRLLGRAPILSTAFTAREVEDGSCAARLRAFGDAVRAARATDVTRPAIWSPQAA